MKKSMGLLAIAGLVGSVFASVAGASQLPMHMAFTAQLETFNVDPKADHLRFVTDGKITYDVTQNQLRLTLFVETPCTDRRCLPVRPMPVVFALPIVDIRQDGCGSTVYTAKRDLRPVDGSLQVLTLVNHATRLCDDLGDGVDVRLTEKMYSRSGHAELKYESSFTGDRLKRDFFPVSMPEDSIE